MCPTIFMKNLILCLLVFDVIYHIIIAPHDSISDVRVSYSGFPTLDSFESISNEIPFVNSFPLFPTTLSFEL